MSEGVMSLDEFLGHKTSDSGGGDTAFLRWKNRQPPKVDVWLHTKAPIVSVWQHGWPRVVERTSKEDGEKRLEVWGGTWNCWEPEAVLRRQYYREKETGLRKTPPTICPHCLLIEAVRAAVDAGDLKWTDVVFSFDVGNDSSRVLHAGGLYNAFGKDDLTTDEIDQLKKARIYRKEAWKENSMAKCSYVLRVVDNDAPGDGIQIAFEGAGLGDKIKAVISDRMTSVGREAGNPMLSPYCIRLEHLPNEARFDAKYKAIMMERIALSSEVRRLIVEAAPPDVSKLTAPGNPKKLRASMEEHWCGPEGLIDWDVIFGPAEAAFAETEKADDATSFPYGENAEDDDAPAAAPPKPAPRPAPVARPAAPPSRPVAPPKAAPMAPPKPIPAAPPPSSGEIVACDDCSGEMYATDVECPHCGKRYEDAAPPPPPMRSRSAAKQAAATVAPKAAPKPAPKAEPDQNADWGMEPSEDGMPF